MNQWTGESRHQLYLAMEEGRLTDARNFLITFPKLTKSDFKPVDIQALDRLQTFLTGNPSAQREIAFMLANAHKAIRDFTMLCFKHLKDFPGDALAEVFLELFKYAMLEYETEFEKRKCRLAQYFREFFKNEEKVQQILKDMPDYKILSLTPEFQHIINDYIEIMLIFPTSQGMQAIGTAPEFIKREIYNKVRDQISQVDQQLKTGKAAEVSAEVKKQKSRQPATPTPPSLKKREGKPAPWDELFNPPVEKWEIHSLDYVLNNYPRADYYLGLPEQKVLQAMAACQSGDDLIRTMRKAIAAQGIVSRGYVDGVPCDDPWDGILKELKYLAYHFRSAERFDAEISGHYLPKIRAAIEERIPAMEKDTSERFPPEMAAILTSYLILAPEPEEVFKRAFRLIFGERHFTEHTELRQPGNKAGVEKSKGRFVINWSSYESTPVEEKRHFIGRSILELSDQMAIVRPWWSDYIVTAIQITGWDRGHGWMTLYRLERDGQSKGLEMALDTLETKKSGQRGIDIFKRNMKAFTDERNREYPELFYIRSRGIEAMRSMMNDLDIIKYYLPLLEYFVGREPGIVLEHFHGMMRYKFDRMFFYHQQYNFPPLLKYYLQDPVCRPVAVAWLAESIRTGGPELMDLAFRFAFHMRELFEEHGFNLLELAACSLCRTKVLEARKAILRMQGLVEHGTCTPAEAAAAMEPAFTTDEPMLWRAAAEAINVLRKKEFSIRLQDPERIKEILAKDPEKYGKFLAPLLD